MISVIIATNESERTLVPTLAALVPGAVAGVVREVIVADAGSRDETAKIADIAGCRLTVTPGPLGARLRAAAALARADWLWFLRPGSVPEATWIDETERFIRDGSELPKAAVLRWRPGGSSLAEAVALAAAALGARPRPQQGLLIAKTSYERLGGHDTRAADPEGALLRSLGRRRITTLAAAMAWRTPAGDPA